MEEDDDLFVVIIGDEETVTDNYATPSIHIKTEMIPSDEICQKILEYGEVIQSSDLLLNVKEEIEDYDDGYNDNEELQNHNDNYSDYDSITNEVQNVFEFWDHGFDDNIEKRSIVQMLRDHYPDWGKDELVVAVKTIMQNVKPPPLPEVHYTESGGFYKCVECEKQLETVVAAGRHYEERHGPRYRKCFGCSAEFRSRTNLYKHEKFSCSSPDKAIVLKARELFLARGSKERPYMQKDKNLRNENKRYACAECPADFTTKVQLRAHENLHAGVRPHVCRLCPAAYTSASGLKSHMVKHSNIQFICDHCGRSFKKKDCLITHLNTHLPQRKYGCEECSKRYASKYALQLHVDRVHLGLPPPCPCRVCGLRFNKMSILKEHMKNKHHMDLITRNMFMKALPTLPSVAEAMAQVVRQHERPPDPPPALEEASSGRVAGAGGADGAAGAGGAAVRAPRARLQCSWCDKTYAYRQDLLWHERAHAAPPPKLQCDVCNRLYSRVSVLKKHLKSAHGMVMMSRKKFLKSLPRLMEIKAEIVHKGQAVPLLPPPAPTPGAAARSDS